MEANSPSKWKFVGGRLCLDFTNTVDGRLEEKSKNSLVLGITKDKFGGYEDLADWAVNIGIINEAAAKKLAALSRKHEKESNKIFERALILREAMFRIFRYNIEGWAPLEEDIKTLNDECTLAREKEKLIYRSKKFEWDFDTVFDELDSIIWPIALSGAELLISEQLGRVRECSGENCGWLFLDTSKNHSRQWCDMKDCGNVAKVRRYREKQK